MKAILIKIPESFILIDIKESSTILPFLPHLTPMRQDYENGRYVYRPTTDSIELTITDEGNILPGNPLEEKLREDVKNAERRWLDYYNKANELEKLNKELRAKLNEIGEKAS